MRDWVIRTVKTFVQAFFGVLIPAVVAMLQDGWPESWGKVWVILGPTVAAALAAAICAVWNIILEAMRQPEPVQAFGFSYGEEMPDPEEEQEDYTGRH